MSKQWYCNGWLQKVETPNTEVHGHCDSTVDVFNHPIIMLWYQDGTYFLQVPVLTQLFPVCLQEGSHQMSQELGWLYGLQLPAVVVVPYSAFLCEKSPLVVPETYQNNWADQSHRMQQFENCQTWSWHSTLETDLQCCAYKSCSVSKVPYATKIKYEAITVLNVADPVHTTDSLILVPCINYQVPKNKVLYVISGFYNKVDEICTLLGYHYLLYNPEKGSSQYNAWLTHKLQTRKLSYSICLTCCAL